MKWFLLLIMAGGAIAIFYFRDEIRGTVEKNTTSEPGTQPEEIVASGGDSATGSPGQSTPSGTPPGGTSKPPVKPVEPHPGKSADDALAKRYPMPKFRTIDQAVGNWNAIPPSAFPRRISISKAVKIVLPGGIGSSSIPAGSSLFALAGRAGMLTVGKTKTTTARGQVDINDTNYKQILGKEFDAWKEHQQNIVMKKRARHRTVIAQTRVPAKNLRKTGDSKNYEAELGKRPDQQVDGTVPLMIASLKRGDISEITPDIIENWGPIIREVVDGQAYWTATVEYKTRSMFGEINTEAQALMRFGKVLSWVYTGSGETVP